MSVSVLGRVSREASIMLLPDWALWLAIYWFGMYALFIGWYADQIVKGKKPKMHPLVAAFGFLFIGFTPLIIVIMALKKTKR